MLDGKDTTGGASNDYLNPVCKSGSDNITGKETLPEHHSNKILLRSGRTIRRWQPAPYARIRGWNKATTVDESQFPANNFQSRRDIRSIATPEGRIQIRELAKNYKEGQPVSMPGAQKALHTASQLVARFQADSSLTQEEKQGLTDLSKWIHSAIKAGCLHDTTEQICQCVAHVHHWFNVYRNPEDKFHYHKISLNQILQLPWRHFQTRFESFDKAFRDLYHAYDWDLHDHCLKTPGISIKWPRICTYESLNIEFILWTMGLPCAVEGHLQRYSEVHDKYRYNCKSFPDHDLIHAGRIIYCLLKYFLQKNFADYKDSFPIGSNFPPLDTFPEGHIEKALDEMNTVFCHMDSLLKEVTMALSHYPKPVQHIIYIMLFDCTHEGFSICNLIDKTTLSSIDDSVKDACPNDYSVDVTGVYRNDDNYHAMNHLESILGSEIRKHICVLGKEIFTESIHSFNQGRPFDRKQIKVPAESESILMSVETYSGKAAEWQHKQI